VRKRRSIRRAGWEKNKEQAEGRRRADGGVQDGRRRNGRRQNYGNKCQGKREKMSI
jgi:hypothetical protein